MIGVYDLYDLHSIFTGIRLSPNSKINCKIILNIIRVLKTKEDRTNQFRVAIQSILEQDEEHLYDFAFVENKYTYFPLPFLKDEKIYQLLIEACEQLLVAIKEENTEKIYDLADCLHDLPIFLTQNKYTIPKQFWKNEIEGYRRKWDKNFLKKSQKRILDDY